MDAVGRFTLRVNRKCQNVFLGFFYARWLAHRLVHVSGGGGSGPDGRTALRISDGRRVRLPARIATLLLPPLTCCVNPAAGAFDPGTAIPVSLRFHLEKSFHGRTFTPVLTSANSLPPKCDSSIQSSKVPPTIETQTPRQNRRRDAKAHEEAAGPTERRRGEEEK